MQRAPLTGTRIRERRIMMGLKQADLARAAEISPSYLNLIEHNRRRIGGALLGRIARVLEADIAMLTRGAEAQQIDHLTEAAGAHDESGPELDRIDEFVGRFPGWTRVVAAQQRRIAGLEHRVASLTDRLAHDPFLAASLHEVLSKVSSIQSTASILIETTDLDSNWTARFHRNLAADSRKLAEGASALVSYLEAEDAGELSAVSPQEELEAFLNRHTFHFPALEGAAPEEIEATITALTEGDAALRSDAALGHARSHLLRYVRESAKMPMAAFSEAADVLGHDPARLAEHFGVDVAAAFRRLAALPPDAGDAQIGLVTCDGAGALLLRKATDLLPMPRFGAACALWPLYAALTRPLAPIRATLAMASRPGQRFTVFAYCRGHQPAGFDGPSLSEAMMLIVPATRVMPADAPDEIVGTACRVCARRECPARREPSLLADGFDSVDRSSNNRG